MNTVYKEKIDKDHFSLNLIFIFQNIRKLEKKNHVQLHLKNYFLIPVMPLLVFSCMQFL